MTRLSMTGITWKLLNSAWILFSLIGSAWIGFLIIGKKARDTVWLKTALVYAILQIGLFILLMICPMSYSLESACIFFWLLVGIVSVVHALIANRKYLICREILLTGRADEKKAKDFRDAIRLKYEEEGVIPKRIMPIQRKEKININTCTEEDYVELPGIGVVEAKKAIAHRKAQGAFQDKDEFYAVTGLKPHFILQTDEMITVDDTAAAQANATNTTERKGRKLDL